MMKIAVTINDEKQTTQFCRVTILFESISFGFFELDGSLTLSSAADVFLLSPSLLSFASSLIGFTKEAMRLPSL